MNRCFALLLVLAVAACAGPAAMPTASLAPTPFPQAPAGATFPAPPQPTASVELVLPAPLPTPGGPVIAYPSLNSITDLAFAPDGSLWTAGGCELARLEDGVWEQRVACDQIDGNIRHLAFAPDGAVWLATEWTVFRLDGAELSRYDQQLPLALAVDAQGVAWVSHNPALGGDWLSTFDGRTWHPMTDTLGVGVVTNLSTTPDGGIWASGAAGVARLAGPGGPRLYTTADGLPADGVVDLAVGPDGALWAACFAALARLAGDRWTAHALGIPNAQIKAIAPGADRVWLAGDRGVFSLAFPSR